MKWTDSPVFSTWWGDPAGTNRSSPACRSRKGTVHGFESELLSTYSCLKGLFFEISFLVKMVYQEKHYTHKTLYTHKTIPYKTLPDKTQKMKCRHICTDKLKCTYQRGQKILDTKKCDKQSAWYNVKSRKLWNRMTIKAILKWTWSCYKANRFVV